MGRLQIHDTPLSGLKLIERQQAGDERGFLERLFCHDELAAAGWVEPVAQINRTWTAYKGTIRGMHYQNPPNAETKLVICLRGAIWDVAVDVRAQSSSLLDWHGETLSAENRRAMLVPKGYAHGFQTLTDDVELIYCHSQAYTPAAETGLHPLDERLAIPWPLPMSMLSTRDSNHPPIGETFSGVMV